MTSYSDSSSGISISNNNHSKEWIRGVNIGGWLVIERYIVPYFFAITDCHIQGDLCWYPGQVSVNTTADDYKLCDITKCNPQWSTPVIGGPPDYPLDEYTLGETFLKANKGISDPNIRTKKGIEIAERWFNSHFNNFIQEEDIAALATVGITHMRVPIPHWILGSVLPDEPWIVGNRWENFIRLLSYARKYKLHVWPDIHTAPGSQNGFDNSGQSLPYVTCHNWIDNPAHVERSLQVIDNVTKAIVHAGYQDVVTGFSPINEPFKDCNQDKYRHFLQMAKEIIYRNLGTTTAIYAGDLFLANTFNDGEFWLNEHNTYLDSHYYQVFEEKPRELSPRQHIAYTCQNQWKDATSCCYQDAKKSLHKPWSWFTKTNTKPSQGIQRIFSEWSLAYDTLPVLKLYDLMQGIATNGTVPELHKDFNIYQKDFLKHYAQAQMVAFESIETQTSVGWFFWTIKMEGGAFAEWDFLRGVKEGWIPVLPDKNQPSEEIYGTCYDIIWVTDDDPTDVVHTFPDPNNLPDGVWIGNDINDKVVVTHGKSLLKRDGIHHRQRNEVPDRNTFLLILYFVIGAIIVHYLQKYVRRRRKQAQYEHVTTTSIEI